MAVNPGYVKSPQGILKILEIIAICIAFACLADLDSDNVFKVLRALDDKYATRFDLFMAVFVIGWVLVLSVFFISLCGVESNITTEKNWNLLLLIFSLLFALLFIVASALIAEHPLDPIYEDEWNKSALLRKYPRILTVCVFFGFLSAVLLLADAFLACKKIGKESPGSNA